MVREVVSILIVVGSVAEELYPVKSL